MDYFYKNANLNRITKFLDLSKEQQVSMINAATPKVGFSIERQMIVLINEINLKQAQTEARERAQEKSSKTNILPVPITQHTQAININQMNYQNCTFTVPQIANTSQTNYPNSISTPQTTQKSKFTPQEDELLIQLISTKGTNDWNGIASQFQNRTARQCRDRFTNYINPKINKGDWSKEEDEVLMNLGQQFGNKWSKIYLIFFPVEIVITVRIDLLNYNKLHQIKKLM